MLGWSAIDIPMLTLLPVLLLLSGFFSGSETALFALTETERMALRRRESFAARAVQALLANPRLLLITVLLGNMTVNVLYFVISSVLVMNSELGVWGRFALAGLFLVSIVLLGEVMPKLVANARRATFGALVAPPLLALHQLIGPLRRGLDKLVVTPLSRLTAPPEAPPRLDHDELAALLELSGHTGVIDAEEQRLLQDVLNLGRLKVRHVMTPRVRIAAVPVTGTRENVLELVRQTRLTRLPVYDGDLDNIIGLLHVKSYLLDRQAQTSSIRDRVEPVRFVPEMASLDQLLNHFRSTQTPLAMVVDEFGGTAGIVAIEDVVEELVGDISAGGEEPQAQPQLIGRNRWRVGGDLSVHEWAAAFGQQLISPRVATLSGLIVAHLGRPPDVGDTVQLGNVRLEVEQVDHARVATAIVTLLDEQPPGALAT